ncbi:MAG: hypothetical protein ACLP9L_41595 [Thermoguttaceae bacterium]
MNIENYPHVVIDDYNAHRFVDGDLAGKCIDGDFAFEMGYLGWEKPGSPHAFIAPRPIGDPIPRSQWHDLIKAGQGSFLSDLVKRLGIRAKDQGKLKYCWVYGSTRAVEVARAVSGLPLYDLAPESVGGPCTGWRNTGGYASEAFDQFQDAGACQSSFLDAPHSLQPNRWKPGWQENAKLHEAVQWASIGTSYDDVITCLLKRIPVAAGLDWWGHLVCFLDPVILPDGSIGVLFQNSWGVDWPVAGANGLATLTEAKATPDGAAAPQIVTFSDT